jgi:hypothetical protein
MTLDQEYCALLIKLCRFVNRIKLKKKKKFLEFTIILKNFSIHYIIVNLTKMLVYVFQCIIITSVLFVLKFIAKPLHAPILKFAF